MQDVDINKVPMIATYIFSEGLAIMVGELQPATSNEFPEKFTDDPLWYYFKSCPLVRSQLKFAMVYRQQGGSHYQTQLKLQFLVESQ
jgi:hypothetical protein